MRVFAWWALLALAQTAPAGERRLNLTIAATHTVNTPWVYALQDWFVPQLVHRLQAETAIEEVNVTEVYGGALSKWKVSLETVGIGLADIGWVGSLWEPAKLPLQNITYHLPFVTDDLALLVRTFNTIHRELPAAREAWRAQNQVYLGATGVDTYHLLTTFPLRSLDDLRGRKILAPGPSAVWLAGTGAVPVDGALSTYYTQLKTGVADGTLTILTGVQPYRLHEVAPYVTLVGIGAQVTGALTFNLDTWRRLPPDAQRIVRQLGEQYSLRAAAETARRYDGAMEILEREGATVGRLTAVDKQRWIDGLPPYGREWVARQAAKDLPATKMLALFMNTIRESGGQPLRAWDEEGND